MYTKITTFLITALLFTSSASKGLQDVDTVYSSVAPKPISIKINPAATIRFIGPIMSRDWFNKANKVVEYSSKFPEVFLIINSPGGSVPLMEQLINSIEIAQARGVKVSCIVGVYAASAAYNILDRCDNRYAFSSSKLLFHPIRVMAEGTVTAPQAAELAFELNKFDEELLTRLCSSIVNNDVLKCQVVKEAYYAEKFWSAKVLAGFATPGYLVLINNIENYNDVFTIEEAPSYTIRIRE